MDDFKRFHSLLAFFSINHVSLFVNMIPAAVYRFSLGFDFIRLINKVFLDFDPALKQLCY